MSKIKYLMTLSMISTSIFLSGCGRSPDSNFYILNPAPAHTLKQYNSCRKVIALDSVNLAKYLDKPNIVTRLSPHHVKVSEFNRWVEPLDESIQRVLQQNLSHQLKNSAILTVPVRGLPNISYKVAVSIDTFDMNSEGVTTLVASWYIYNNSRKLSLTKEKVYHAYAEKPVTYGSTVVALNQNITSLSKDIGRSIYRLGCS